MTLRDNLNAYAVAKALHDALGNMLDAAKPRLVAQATDAIGHGSVETDYGKVSIAGGKERVYVTDEAAYLRWATSNHPHAIREVVDASLLKSLRIVDGVVIDGNGLIPDGVGITTGSTYPSVRYKDGGREAAINAVISGAFTLDNAERLMLGEGDTK